MKTKININGKDVEITLTPDQVKQLTASENIIERVKTPQDAIEELGECDQDVIDYRLLQSICGLSEHILNNQLAIIIVKALNEGWISDWDNSNQSKYFVWWNMQTKTFSCHYDNYWNSYSNSCARLCLKSATLCKHIGDSKELVKVFKSFMLQ